MDGLCSQGPVRTKTGKLGSTGMRVEAGKRHTGVGRKPGDFYLVR